MNNSGVSIDSLGIGPSRWLPAETVITKGSPRLTTDLQLVLRAESVLDWPLTIIEAQTAELPAYSHYLHRVTGTVSMLQRYDSAASEQRNDSATHQALKGGHATPSVNGTTGG